MLRPKLWNAPRGQTLVEHSAGEMVLAEDHYNSHACDDNEERLLFEKDVNLSKVACIRFDPATKRYVTDDPTPQNIRHVQNANTLLAGWLFCAHSRAARFGEIPQ